ALQGGSWPLLAAAPLLAGETRDDESRVALVGLAGGTVARELLLALPRARVAVEARDGRIALAEATSSFDAVVVDAYRGAYVPPHLVTREFFALARSRLAPGGAC